ncbi:MAG: hypothetical protein ABI430_02425 [Candidatus Taylorbacteria bacterium]
MSTLIENLKAKPKKTRKRIALGLSSLITFAIFLFWMAALPSRVSQSSYADVTPFKNLQSNVAGVVGAFQDSFKDLGGKTQD